MDSDIKVWLPDSPNMSNLSSNAHPTTVYTKRGSGSIFSAGLENKPLNKISHKNQRSLFENEKYAKMFVDYDICTIFRNGTNLKISIVKTQL